MKNIKNVRYLIIIPLCILLFILQLTFFGVHSSKKINYKDSINYIVNSIDFNELLDKYSDTNYLDTLYLEANQRGISNQTVNGVLNSSVFKNYTSNYIISNLEKKDNISYNQAELSSLINNNIDNILLEQNIKLNNQKKQLLLDLINKNSLKINDKIKSISDKFTTNEKLNKLINIIKNKNLEKNLIISIIILTFSIIIISLSFYQGFYFISYPTLISGFLILIVSLFTTIVTYILNQYSNELLNKTLNILLNDFVKELFQIGIITISIGLLELLLGFLIKKIINDNSNKKNRPVVLCILDGVGIRQEVHGNALLQADMPNFNNLWNNYPHSLLEASGELVGLPDKQMGNSEVGHMNIGAGRIVDQPLQLINKKIKSKEIFDNKNILEVMNYTKEKNSKLHIMGLLSDGGVHSHIDHLMAIIEMAKINNIENLYFHIFLDGRDTLPNVAINYLKKLESKIIEEKIGSISTMSGRYYAMDRDNRWDRVKQAYDNMTKGTGEEYKTYQEVIKNNYQDGIEDEFIKPAILDKKGLINSNDGIICFNFRPDRIKEILSCLTNTNYNCFDRKKLDNLKLVTMMPVSDEVIGTAAYKQDFLINTLGEYISKKGLNQLRIAETEKYAHVTYFFDGGIEKKLKNCKRILIPSSQVATYDLKPRMSALEITDNLLKELDKSKDLVILNYANGDMVGHTGNLDATVEALEVLDNCIGILKEKVESLNGTLIITADHGNSDYMLDEKENIITSHSTSKVPFIINNKKYNLSNGKLADIAPTILKIMKIKQPKEMTGKCLLKKRSK